MLQKFVTSISTEFGEPVVTSNGASDAGKIVALDDNGKIDQSVLPMAAILPAGVVQYFAMATAPAGWLAADGSAVSRTEYGGLFAAIGTTFGSGDGSTTFNLPDLRGEFIRGYDDGRGVDSGRVFGTGQADEFKSHTHSVSAEYEDDNTGGIGWLQGADAVQPSTLNTGATGGAETRPRNVALLACVKY